MEEIGDIVSAEHRLLTELKSIFSQIRFAGQIEPSSLELGLEALKSLRNLVYENMNQLQHEALVLKTAKLLKAEAYVTVPIQWFWNPRQTGTMSEPDLLGLAEGDTIVSAEITTSLIPQGVIDSRMSLTLQKLSTMLGDKYYVVATKEMERRANWKLSKLGYEITVLRP